MTLQQLKYIVAIDRYRSFAKAADALGISQPTLSAMLVKLEDELDVRIFERSNKSVTPTIAGEKIIRQAERTIAEAERINELVSEDKGDVAGDLRLCVVSSIAPYILPKFIRFYTEDYPQVRLSIIELKGDAILAELQQGHIDGAIATVGSTYLTLHEVNQIAVVLQVQIHTSLNGSLLDSRYLNLYTTLIGSLSLQFLDSSTEASFGILQLLDLAVVLFRRRICVFLLQFFV